LLFSVDPEIPVLLRSLTLMIGRFIEFPNATRMVEWNAMCDPHAAAIVYRAPIPVHRSVGLDVTMKVTMGARDIQERFRSKLLRPVLDFAQVWFEHADGIVFHDPLAATTLFDNTICTFKRGTVEIELDSPKLAGMTLWTPEGDDPRHEVATSVRPDRFFEHYFSLFPAEN
jgi:inosine-uridine nucleoside N-ribohydrolase